MPKKAMIMAAGFGTRMRPLTNDMPKPLVPVNGKPLIDYSLEFFAKQGIEDVVINTHYLADMLEDYLHSKSSPPKIIISREQEVLETGGGIKNALSILGDSPFFVINSDVICINGNVLALQRMWQTWDDSEMDVLLLLHKVEDAVGYNGKGDFFVEDNGQLKRRGECNTAPYVFTGVQIIHPRIFDDSPSVAFSLNVLYNKDISRIGAIIHDGNWLHIGSMAELEQAEEWLKINQQ